MSRHYAGCALTGNVVTAHKCDKVSAGADPSSLRQGGLPLGLAHGVKLTRAVAANTPVRWDDVAYDAAADAVKFRREMEARFANG